MSNDFIAEKLILSAGDPEVNGKCLIIGGRLCLPLGLPGKDTSDATALASDILFGKTAYVASGKVTGIIQSIQEARFTPGTVDQIIPSGNYLEGKQIILGDVNLITENIKSGVYIFGVLGTYSGGGGGLEEKVIYWIISPSSVSNSGAMSDLFSNGNFSTPGMEILPEPVYDWDTFPIVRSYLNNPIQG